MNTASAAHNQNKISVLIPVYNSEIFIEQCLDRLLRQKYLGSYEILLLDDASSDATLSIVKNKFNDAKIRIVPNKKRIGLTASINNGIKAAQGDIIAFTNPDCYVGPTWLDEIHSSLLNYDFVGGPVYLFNAKDIKYPWWWNKALEWVVGICPEYNKNFLPLGGNSAFKKSVLLDIENALHVPASEYFYGDDSMRAKIALKKRYRMCFNKNLAAYHHVSIQRFRFSNVIKRSVMEGYCWAARENGVKIFCQRFLAIFLNILKFIFSLNMHYACRALTSASYIIKIIKIYANSY